MQQHTPNRAEHHGGPIRLSERSLTVELPGGSSCFHYIWLRDNSWSGEARVQQTGERKQYTAAIREDIAPLAAHFDPSEGLWIEWNDGRSEERRVGKGDGR